MQKDPRANLEMLSHKWMFDLAEVFLLARWPPRRSQHLWVLERFVRGTCHVCIDSPGRASSSYVLMGAQAWLFTRISLASQVWCLNGQATSTSWHPSVRAQVWVKWPSKFRTAPAVDFNWWSAASLPPGLFSHQSSISFQGAVKHLTKRNANFCMWFKAGLAKLLENISYIMQDNNPAFTKVWSRHYNRSFLSLTSRILRNEIKIDNIFFPKL